MAQCGVCKADVTETHPTSLPEPAEPPDFDTRPGNPLRSTIATWVRRCGNCGYCADDITRPAGPAAAAVAEPAYRRLLEDSHLPLKAREFLCFARLLEHLHQFADAGWSALHGAWVCDDAASTEAASSCRARAIELWKRGKHVGQLFSDELSTEFALVTDLHRRIGEFEHAILTCGEGLDLEDIPPAVEAILRRQLILIQRRDTGAHSMKELLAAPR